MSMTMLERYRLKLNKCVKCLHALRLGKQPTVGCPYCAARLKASQDPLPKAKKGER